MRIAKHTDKTNIRDFLKLTAVFIYGQLLLIVFIAFSSSDVKADNSKQVTFNNTAPAPTLPAVNELHTVGEGSLLLKQNGYYLEAPQVETDVDMQINGMVNRVRLQQRFTNATDEWQEAIYVFPLPVNAAVDQMRIQIGERVIEGKIREKTEARKLYQQAKQQGKRAALTEQQRPNLFTNSIANIPPHASIVIAIEYQQIVDYEKGEFSLRFPMVVGPRYIPGQVLTEETRPVTMQINHFDQHGWATATDQVPDAGRITPPVIDAKSNRRNPVSIRIQLDAGVELAAITSPYHNIQSDRQGLEYRIQLAAETINADRDFVLRWRPEPAQAPRAAIFTEEKNGEHYSMLMLLPPESRIAERLPREIIFVIDTSGSMGGQSIKQAKSALALALTRLNSGDTFNIIQFNSYTSALFPEPRAVNGNAISQAQDYVRSLQANGGTEMITAMSAALTTQNKSHRLRQVIFMTDGNIGNEQALFDVIQQQLGESRLFTVGIGSAPNGYFMRRAASYGKGTHTFIGKLNEVQNQMAALFEKIERPVLKDIGINWPNENMQMWPQHISDLYQGEPLILTVRHDALLSELEISGKLDRRPWQSTLALSHAKSQSGISQLWARNKITALMQQQDKAEFDAVKQQIIDTALLHHLVSAYTSLVAIDITPVKPSDKAVHRRAVPTQLPAGWQREKVFGQAYPATATDARLNFIIGLLLLWLTWFCYRRPGATT